MDFFPRKSKYPNTISATLISLQHQKEKKIMPIDVFWQKEHVYSGWIFDNIPIQCDDQKNTLTISILSPLSEVKPSGTWRACIKAWVNWGMKGNNSCFAMPWKAENSHYTLFAQWLAQSLVQWFIKIYSVQLTIIDVHVLEGLLLLSLYTNTT